MALNSKDIILMMSDENGNMKPIGKVMDGPRFEVEDVQDIMPVNRKYSFSCELTPESREALVKLASPKELKDAQTMLDHLSELYRQFHSGKYIRRERRAIKREYDRLAATLIRHCTRYGITLKRKENE